MFFPKAMSEIELIVPAKDLLAVTRVLSSYGVFHQTDSSSPAQGADGKANVWLEKAAEYASFERRIQVVMQALSVDEGQPPASNIETMVEAETIRPDLEQIEGEVRRATDDLANERKRQEGLESTLRQLEPVDEIDLDISLLRKPRFMFSMLGQIPAANVDRLQTSLARIPYVFLTLRPDPAKPVVWLAGPQSNADALERAARSAYLNPLVLPEGYQGTPAQIISSIRKEIEAAKQKVLELDASLGQLAEKHAAKLRELLWQVHTNRVLADAIVRFGKLKYTYVITGWVPTDSLEELTGHLKYASKEILIETLPTTRGGHNAHVPVALASSKFLKPFQLLVNTYARPRYGELDPTFLIAFMFPFLFGAMFGDIGQGLVLVVLGWLIATKRFMKGLASLGPIIAICGISATVFGFLYGSLFGFEEGVHLFGMELEPIWISPIHHIMDVLMVAIGAGVVLLILGYLIGIFNYVLEREPGHLWFGHNGIAGFVLYVSLLGLGWLTIPVLFGGGLVTDIPIVPFIVLAVLVSASAIAIMFSEVFIHLVEGHRPLIHGGIGTYLIQAGVELFEVVISMFSNTLSFVRVGAFAVAHGGLSQAIFILAELGGGHGIGYWITIVIGNVFIVGFEGLIVGIQTMRLSYYEFFSKFFKGGGLRFEPLSLNSSQNE